MAVKRRSLLAAVLIAATILAYLPALRAEFIWDDDDYLTENPHLRDLDGLKEIWVPMNTPQYYPVVFTTFWIEHHLYPPYSPDEAWGLHPFGYHLVNVLLHAANALLVVALARLIRIPPGVAWAIGFLFALHPVHVESVAWITERKNVLSTCFYFLAAIAYLRFDAERRTKGKHPSSVAHRPKAKGNRSANEANHSAWSWYALALLLFALALLSKSVTASLPVAILIFLLWMREKITASRLAPLIPMVVLGLVAGLHTGFIEKANVGALGPEWDRTFLEHLIIASKALLFYPWKIMAPYPLIFIYPRWETEPVSVMDFLPLAVAPLAGFALLLLWTLKGVRWPFLALAFYGVTIFPALGFANVYPHIFSFVADHFQYLASLGMIALLAGTGAALIPHARIGIIITTIICLLFGVLTFNQSLKYDNAETLYLATVQHNPQAWMAETNLSRIRLEEAQEAMDDGDDEAALEAARAAERFARGALEDRPAHDAALTNLAEALRLQARFNEAIDAMHRAIESMRRALESHRSRAETDRPDLPHWLNVLLHLDLREGHRNQVARANQILAQNHTLLGRLHEMSGERHDAVAAYETALTFDPDLALAHNRLAQIALADGRIDDAAAHYRFVLRRYPDHFRALIVLSDHARQGRRYDEALASLSRAIDAAGTDEERQTAVYRLAWLRATAREPSVRNGEEALALAEQLVVETGRSSPWAFDALGAACAEVGRFDEAVHAAEQAGKLARTYGLDDFAGEIEARIDTYRAGRPHRE